MRIIHAVNCSETSIRGVERNALNLALAQVNRGSSVMMMPDCLGPLAESCHRHSVPVAVTGELKPEDGSVARPAHRAVDFLVRQFEEFDAELIHCHTLPAAAHAVPAANRLNIPAVVTFPNLRALAAAKNSGLRFTMISPSKANYEELKKSGIFGPGELYHVGHGTKAVAARPSSVREWHSPNLISVGQLNFGKGVDLAILAMAVLRRRRGPDCPVLNIYGDGDLEIYLKEVVGAIGLDDIVRFHGIQPGILESCPDTDILIMSSRGETGPLVVLEAMSRGMPIVATDVGSVADILPDSRYGRVVPADSIPALADAIDSLLSDITERRFDPDLAIERHRSLFSIEKMAENMDTIYKKAKENDSAPRLPRSAAHHTRTLRVDHG